MKRDIKERGTSIGKLTTFDWFLMIGVTVCSIFYALFDSYTNGNRIDWMSIIAAVTGVANVVLIAKGMIINYFFGLISVAVYSYIAFKSHLYGLFALNFLYNVPMQFIGWFSWKRQKAIEADDLNIVVQPRKLDRRKRIILALFSALVIATTGVILQYCTDDAQPYTDSATTVLSIIATFLMIKAYTENWVLWILSNILSVAIWVIAIVKSPGAEAGIMVIMWIFYLINSVNGYIVWKRAS